MSTGPPLKLGKNPSAFLILAVSILSDRTNSGSKGFDFTSDDILCLYEDCGNYDSSNGSHSNPVVRAIDCVIFIDDNIYIWKLGIHPHRLRCCESGSALFTADAMVEDDAIIALHFQSKKFAE
ncbi:hypothetical protein TorRG33x02_059950 [Trema orientale]|uniref:Uncharacterized protein n=1 Tax=Trema orientale TaxID=63057 RepID=A0A2P5FK46_TREOI|nr:hypothetical protein TorRG33x02_059950 [Trema orientale]